MLTRSLPRTTIIVQGTSHVVTANLKQIAAFSYRCIIQPPQNLHRVENKLWKLHFIHHMLIYKYLLNRPAFKHPPLASTPYSITKVVLLTSLVQTMHSSF